MRKSGFQASHELYSPKELLELVQVGELQDVATPGEFDSLVAKHATSEIKRRCESPMISNSISDGPQELRQMATEASTKVQEHLNAIKELSKKLEDDRKAPNS